MPYKFFVIITSNSSCLMITEANLPSHNKDHTGRVRKVVSVVMIFRGIDNDPSWHDDDNDDNT